MKSIEQLSEEHNQAQKVVLDKAIEITLFNMGVDTERVSAKDFDQARRLISGMDLANEKAEGSIAKIREDADKEIEGLVNQLDVLTMEIKAKQAPETPAETQNT